MAKLDASHPAAHASARLTPCRLAMKSVPGVASAQPSLTAEGEIGPIIQVEFLEFEQGTGGEGVDHTRDSGLADPFPETAWI